MEKRQATVYLAGSINGHQTLEAANNWRGKATSKLELVGFNVLNPLRGRKYDQIHDPFEVVNRDLKDIRASDILLVEMDHENRAYIGTGMEIFAAQAWDKRIVLWGNANLGSYWLQRYASAWFSSLDEAITYLTSLMDNDELEMEVKNLETFGDSDQPGRADNRHNRADLHNLTGIRNYETTLASTPEAPGPGAEPDRLSE